MGGLVCGVPTRSILPETTIPTAPQELPEFDHRLRQCFSQPQIVQGIVDAGHAERAMALLGKSTWSMTDRTELFDMVEGLYTS